MATNGASAVDIPTIDITNPESAPKLLDAAVNLGFVFIENMDTGISPADIDHMFQLSKDFFASPAAEKEEVSISSNAAGKNHGWLSRGVEKLDPATQQRPDVKEAFNMGEPIDGKPQQPMPKSLQPHTQTVMEFQDKCHRLCQKVLELFATALHIDRDWFTSRHDRSKAVSGSVFRFLYYPKVDSYDDIDIRAGAHSDYGSITLLFQQRGQPGLEIKTPAGAWAPVPVDPGSGEGDLMEQDRSLPILVNIGDLLEDWTGGLLKSTLHRVIFPKSEYYGDRYSIAYFCHPLDDARLEPVPSKLVEDHAKRTGRNPGKGGKVITARDHLMERLAATYTVK